MTVTSFPRGTRSDVVGLALISRLIILGGMALSDVLIPDHNPGDDVLRFDLRLNGDGGGCIAGDANYGECRRCFCLEGHACDGNWSGSRKQVRRHNPVSKECATSKPWANGAASSPPSFTNNIYSLILKPNTKWDGARFLELAGELGARMPSKSAKEATSEQSFGDSEQAQAFFPLFPLCIRYLALFLLRFVPSLLLPSTFEGVIALAALFINTFCFAVAAIAMYDMTTSVLRRSLEDLKQPEIDRASFLVSALFCFNPASVFFTASYSESLFAALTFGGHALAARGVLSLAVIPWTFATYARSNGTFSSIWILLVGCGKVISQVSHVGCSSANADIPISRKIQRTLSFLQYWYISRWLWLLRAQSSTTKEEAMSSIVLIAIVVYHYQKVLGRYGAMMPKDHKGSPCMGTSNGSIGMLAS